MPLRSCMALLLSGCGIEGASEIDPDAVLATQIAWADSGLPGPSDCLDRVVQRQHATTSSYVDHCSGPNSDPDAARQSAGCLTSGIVGLFGRRVWIVELSPSSGGDLLLIQHELLHALTYCYMDRPHSDPFDANHTETIIWSARSGGTSVQARAEAILWSISL